MPIPIYDLHDLQQQRQKNRRDPMHLGNNEDGNDIEQDDDNNSNNQRTTGKLKRTYEGSSNNNIDDNEDTTGVAKKQKKQRTNSSNNNKTGTFPVILFQLLNECSSYDQDGDGDTSTKKGDDIISWSANGTSFIIKDNVKLERDILPSYFNHVGGYGGGSKSLFKYRSLKSTLELWGFENRTSPNTTNGEWSHELFNRNFPDIYIYQIRPTEDNNNNTNVDIQSTTSTSSPKKKPRASSSREAADTTSLREESAAAAAGRSTTRNATSSLPPYMPDNSTASTRSAAATAAPGLVQNPFLNQTTTTASGISSLGAGNHSMINILQSKATTTTDQVCRSSSSAPSSCSSAAVTTITAQQALVLARVYPKLSETAGKLLLLRHDQQAYDGVKANVNNLEWTTELKILSMLGQKLLVRQKQQQDKQQQQQQQQQQGHNIPLTATARTSAAAAAAAVVARSSLPSLHPLDARQHQQDHHQTRIQELLASATIPNSLSSFPALSPSILQSNTAAAAAAASGGAVAGTTNTSTRIATTVGAAAPPPPPPHLQGVQLNSLSQSATLAFHQIATAYPQLLKEAIELLGRKRIAIETNQRFVVEPSEWNRRELLLLQLVGRHAMKKKKKHTTQTPTRTAAGSDPTSSIVFSANNH